MALSPMMQQYLEVKKQYGDAIVFYRLGDFYEMFFDDAKLVSKELELTLTGRQCGEAERAPMCGVPYHSADTYIGRLVERGYSVVICEQTEDPATAKGLVRREVVRIVTPGTVTDPAQLTEGKNNYLAALWLSDEKAALALADVSTGEIRATLCDIAPDAIVSELAVYSPREILVSREPAEALREMLSLRFASVVNATYGDRFVAEDGKDNLRSLFAFSEEELAAVEAPLLSALAGLIAYIDDTQKTDLSYLKRPLFYEGGEYLEMDVNTRRNLELCETMRSRDKRGTLLWVLDKTETSMGARLLRGWLEQPLRQVPRILRRQAAVKELFDNFVLRDELTDALRGLLDLERLMTRVVNGTAGGKDLVAIARTLSVLPVIRALLADCKSDELSEIAAQSDPVDDIADLIGATIVDDPPFSVREGGFIRAGVNAELDRLRDILANSKDYLAGIEEREKEATGIKNMKIGYNRVFGYYIEVSKSNIPDVPREWIRKQTLTTGERYITEELKQLETTILGANDKICAIEYSIFQKLREQLIENVRRIQKAAEVIAKVDVYRSLALVAAKNGYNCPEVDIGFTVQIKDGRHPVVEQFVGSDFVPNDTLLDIEQNKLLIITGPNMAGKSTYMRQTALIVLMAQIGSFVPAAEARIGIVDRLFTRVGASDDLASGQSTFMLEMNEVAYILKNATRRSLIIYDEIGRGTSTFDGMSMARAIAEYTAGKKIGARSLFATHYHELTELANTLPGVVNYHITARKKGDGVIFLRKIVRGAADDSYGIEVASLAGVPKEVIRRAKEVLATLNEGGALTTPKKKKQEEAIESFSIEDYIGGEIKDRIRSLDINQMTPMEAFNLIWELKQLLDKG